MLMVFKMILCEYVYVISEDKGRSNIYYVPTKDFIPEFIENLRIKFWAKHKIYVEWSNSKGVIVVEYINGILVE